MRREDLPSPEKIATELRKLADVTENIARSYKEIYDAAFRPDGGGSIGTIGSKDSASDPTAAATFSPGKRQLRYAARQIKRAIWRARQELERADERGDLAFQELPGGAMRDKYERRLQFRRELRDKARGPAG